MGAHEPVGPLRGDHANLYYNDEHVGTVLRTRDRVKPLFVSPGHMIDFNSSRKLVLACCTRYRLPEPQRIADILAGEEKRDGA